MGLKRNENYLIRLRKNIIKQDPFSLLLANFTKTLQQKDIEKRTALIEDFFRIKINVKLFDDEERKKRGMEESFNFNDINGIYDALIDEFDMPFWAWYSLTDRKDLSKLKDYNKAFIYQIKACNINCPWCYVDDINKNGMLDKGSSFFTITNIIDIFEEERKKQNLNFLRISGGEPTIAVEQWLHVFKELEKRGLDNIYVQSDTNLTTGSFIDLLEKKEEIKGGLLEKVGEYKNFGLLCSFKGTDKENYNLNTGLPLRECEEFLEENIYSFKKMIKAGIDSYPFFYNPNPSTLESFLDRLAREVGEEDVIRRSWVFVLKPYGPEKERLKKRAIREGITNENEIKHYIDSNCQELAINFERAKEKMQEIMQKRFSEDYQQEMRPHIKTGVKN